MALREDMETSGEWLFRRRSYLPLLIVPILGIGMLSFGDDRLEQPVDLVWDFVTISIAMLGLLIRCLTVGFAPARTSGRNTSRQVADQLNTSGAYSIVRHPLYLGNFVIALGLSVFFRSFWVTSVVSLAYWMYYERIAMAEELFLRRKFGASYEAWASRTPAFVPALRGWVHPSLPFSLRTVLRREYTAFLLIFGALLVFELAEHAVVEHRLSADSPWIICAAGAGVVYLALRTLKRRTSLLVVSQR